jgi:cytochrome P450
MLLDPAVLQDPYCFYATLQKQAPVWVVPGTDVVAISSFELLSEAIVRPEDFSSTMHCLLYRDGDGLPARLDLGDAAMPTLATADPPVHTTHRRAVFPELVARRMRTLDDECPRRAGVLGRFDDAETRSTRGHGGNSTRPAAHGSGRIPWAIELPSRGSRLCFVQV